MIPVRASRREDVTFVLIPGAGGQAWYWHRLVPELADRGFDAVAVDLPAGSDDVGLDGYADVVVAAAEGLDDVVVVAQSMGGLVAPLVCARRSVRLLVLLNAMIPAPGETGHAWWTESGLPEFRSEATDMTDVFFHDVPPDVTAVAFARGEPPQSARPFDDPWPLPAWPDVPTRVLAGRDDRLFPLAFQRHLARSRLGLDVDQIPGGHLVALSRPDALAERLADYAKDR
jgi:pimeloyl-ACP methyl ester carboxylesterase